MKLLKYRFLSFFLFLRALENMFGKACWDQTFENTRFQANGQEEGRITDFEQFKEEE